MQNYFWLMCLDKRWEALCYCAVIWSQQGGELQRLVGQESTCDWCNTWTESLLFPWEGGRCDHALRGTGQTGLRLIGLMPLHSASLNTSFVFHGKKREGKMLPQDFEFRQSHPLTADPNPAPRASDYILPRGVRVIHLFSEVEPLSWFYFSPVPISWNAATRVWLSRRSSFQNPTPHLDLQRSEPEQLGWTFTVLSFHKCHRGPVMTREELSVTNTGHILGQAK